MNKKQSRWNIIPYKRGVEMSPEEYLYSHGTLKDITATDEELKEKNITIDIPMTLLSMRRSLYYRAILFSVNNLNLDCKISKGTLRSEIEKNLPQLRKIFFFVLANKYYPGKRDEEKATELIKQFDRVYTSNLYNALTALMSCGVLKIKKNKRIYVQYIAFTNYGKRIVELHRDQNFVF